MLIFFYRQFYIPLIEWVQFVCLIIVIYKEMCMIIVFITWGDY